MSTEFHPLSQQTQSDYDYTISSSGNGMSMDDVSLNSSRIDNPLSSGASVTSKYSRASRKALKNSDLGSSLLLDEHDENGGPSNMNGTSAATSTTAATSTQSFISEDDPFHMFRSDLVQKLASVDDESNRYLTAVRTTDTAANSHAVKEIKKQLKRHVKHAESTLRDLETTVVVVERRREKFPHIDDAELAERRGFVDGAKRRIANAKGEMQGDEVRRKLARDERALTERRKRKDAPAADGSNGGANRQEYAGVRSSSDLEEGGDRAAAVGDGATDDPERSETLLMMRRQDETLEDLDMAVTRVGYMAETIHEEIDTQNAMLKDLEEDLADAEEQLGVVMGKLAKLLKTKSKFQIGLIVVLTLVVMVLFFLVLYF